MNDQDMRYLCSNLSPMLREMERLYEIEAENERLRGTIAAQERIIVTYRDGIERLEAENDRLCRQLSLAEKSIECFEADRIDFEAEVGRLREALELARSMFLEYGARHPSMAG